MSRRPSTAAAPSALLAAHRFLRRSPVSEGGWRSTHGVNCTGSCSWNVFVKDGIVTWESQAVDYPSTGAEMPEYEPRGCPRGASFSWYQYSPLRLEYPYLYNYRPSTEALVAVDLLPASQRGSYSTAR